MEIFDNYAKRHVECLGVEIVHDGTFGIDRDEFAHKLKLSACKPLTEKFLNDCMVSTYDFHVRDVSLLNFLNFAFNFRRGITLIDHYHFNVIVYVRGQSIILGRPRSINTEILSFGSQNMALIGNAMTKKIGQILRAGMECRVSF